ncbi:MAG: hypothetical protein J2P54_02575 [Bradyrhizobiaceae bacterium]|nr:hypothetical protein [Bradyrhizobiaceae bacterium]
MIASPWLDIRLADYEGHMALPEIAQSQMLVDGLESAVRFACAKLGRDHWMLRRQRF